MEQQPFMPSYNNMPKNNFQFIPDSTTSGAKIILVIIQIILWFSLIYSLINPENFYLAIIIYVFYLLFELCGNTSRFLLNKSSTGHIYNKLIKTFRQHPAIKINCTCYHLEKKIVEEKDKDGNIIKKQVEEKVVTFNGEEHFPYYSYRDVSGLFHIDLNSPIFKNKKYIKLSLESSISFADSISYYDYQAFKTNYINLNSHRDEKMDFSDTYYVPNLSYNNLIKISNDEPPYVNFFTFFLSVIFTFALPYEIMLDNISIKGKYLIKKIISTRYDLNSYQYNNMYLDSVPSIILGDNKYNIAPNDYGYIDKNFEVNLPTLEEIEKAKQYGNQYQQPMYYSENNNDNDLPTEEEIKQYQNQNIKKNY